MKGGVTTIEYKNVHSHTHTHTHILLSLSLIHSFLSVTPITPSLFKPLHCNLPPFPSHSHYTVTLCFPLSLHSNYTLTLPFPPLSLHSNYTLTLPFPPLSLHTNYTLTLPFHLHSQLLFPYFER